MLMRAIYSYKHDVWGVGVLLYEMLVGYSPFRHANTKVNLDLMCNKHYFLPSFLSVAAKNVLKKLLEPDPGQRISLYSLKVNNLILIKILLKKHPFFTISFSELGEQKVMAPNV